MNVGEKIKLLKIYKSNFRLERFCINYQNWINATLHFYFFPYYFRYRQDKCLLNPESRLLGLRDISSSDRNENVYRS